MVELIATVESISQAEALLEVGVDILYFGEDKFGLRLPHSFTRDEQQKLTELAHQYGKKVSIAVNAIFHNEGIQAVPEYLTFLKSIGVDSITLGDPGVVNLMKNSALSIPYRYDAQVLVTSSRSINFWAKRGAIGAVVAREVPRDELKILAKDSMIPVEFLVYGATCIHQSKRPLLQNYYNFIEKQEGVTRDRGLFLSEPRKPESHYSIYQDVNGTHIFANNDVLLAQHLQDLTDMGVAQWKLEGIFSPGENFVEIARLFAQARDLIETGNWSEEHGDALEVQIRQLHPANRGVDTGFFLYEPNFVK
ncbi:MULTISPECIES: peptidase U32 family protein [unclassified Facklamia]|uniref:peptidase U32 family protein n=1 Tax=Aerococcaceae TaxID=186827 RepID=UPI0013BAD9F6|nr:MULTISPECIES: peptidase U32 family protein [unclassified Facklamia]NEW65183.1 U32 family peptidase [Facklamia sp. 252]NEW68574.1 U32 family peptidase [Facklamia sp. 253]QQD65985.1 U32 family peptidase [Aerococcaceae bacterium zg-252]